MNYQKSGLPFFFFRFFNYSIFSLSLPFEIGWSISGNGMSVNAFTKTI